MSLARYSFSTPGYMKQNALFFTLLLQQLRIFGHCADEAEHTVANLMLFTRLITKRTKTSNFHSTFSFIQIYFLVYQCNQMSLVELRYELLVPTSYLIAILMTSHACKLFWEFHHWILVLTPTHNGEATAIRFAFYCLADRGRAFSTLKNHTLQ